MRNEAERIVTEVAAALEREPGINIHRFPIGLEYVDGVLTMDGEVERIMAKKRALELAAAVPGVAGIVDRLRVVPAELLPDGEIRDRVCNALLAENLLATCAIRALKKGRFEAVRETGAEAGRIDVEVADGVVVLNGTVPSLSAKRLAGVLAWWVPGSRDVVNGVEVSPAEEDTDDEVVDAVRLVLEKDPFVNAAQIKVSCRDRTVVLEGLVKNGTERQMAEADCWYVFRVDRVTNLLRVQE
jgi:osmotically-inducible protein OsmY